MWWALLSTVILLLSVVLMLVARNEFIEAEDTYKRAKKISDESQALLADSRERFSAAEEILTKSTVLHDKVDNLVAGAKKELAEEKG